MRLFLRRNTKVRIKGVCQVWVEMEKVLEIEIDLEGSQEIDPLTIIFKQVLKYPK